MANISTAVIEGVGHASINFAMGTAQTGQLLALPLYLITGHWQTWQRHWNDIVSLQDHMHNRYSEYMQALLPQDMRWDSYDWISSVIQGGAEGIFLAASSTRGGMGRYTSKTVAAPLQQNWVSVKNVVPSKSYRPLSNSAVNPVNVPPINVPPINVPKSHVPTWTPSSPTTSTMSKHLLKNKLIAQEMAGGHAFEKHVLGKGEFPGWIRTRNQLSQHVEAILNDPTTKMRELIKHRTAYWHQRSSTVIVRNPSASDGGTVFQPRRGYYYFRDELK